MRDVDEYAAATARAAAFVGVASAGESGSEHFLPEPQVRDVLEVVLTEGKDGVGALNMFCHGMDPIEWRRVLHGSPPAGDGASLRAARIGRRRVSFGMMRATTAVMVSLLLAATAGAQQGATITGTVRDSASRPVANADVVALPGVHRARTDSAGKFTIAGMDGGSYTVRARKLGFAPTETTVDISGNGRLNVVLTLDQRMPLLDTVVVRADGSCPDRTLDAFACHRKFGKGLYLDYTDIDEKEPIYAADIFRDIQGFRVDVRSTRNGPVRVAVPSNFHCLVSLVDGRPVSLANPVPSTAIDVIALEVYQKPDDVPKEYERFIWPTTGMATGRCMLVVYWTPRAPTRRS